MLSMVALVARVFLPSCVVPTFDMVNTGPPPQAGVAYMLARNLPPTSWVSNLE